MHGPFCVSVGLAINIYFFGWTVFTGVAAILLLIPLIGILTRQLTKIEKEINEAKDERVKLMNEILSSIRIIKYFVWESRFEKLVAGVRSTEFGKLKKAAVTKSFQQFLANSIAMAGSAVTFIVYYLVHGELDVSTIFSGMAVFTIMTGPLMNLPETINIGISVYTSMNRIADFLEGDEVVSVTLQEELKEEYEEEEKNNTAIVFRGASFSYDPEKPILHDIDVVIPKGQFVSIVGRVGSGKSSLLSALFGDINKDEGYLSVHGNVSYCCEKPWIVNDTIRQNILYATIHPLTFIDSEQNTMKYDTNECSKSVNSQLISIACQIRT
jgi:ABC-type multidrug transport system fused ATPase/permease subunit